MVRLNKSKAYVWENMRITTTLLFVKQLPHAKNKVNVKAPHYKIEQVLC